MAIAPLAVSALATACTGAISPSGESVGREGGRGGSSANDGPTRVAPQTCVLPPTRIWKLTPSQYDATVAHALPGAPTRAAALAGTLAIEVSGFTNDAGKLNVSSAHFAELVDSATALSEHAWTTRASLAPCLDQAPNEVCVRTFVDRFASRAFRRALTTSERDALVDLHRQEKGLGSEADAFKQVVAAVLLSPHFLFRTEMGQGGKRPVLTDFERASALSYFLLDGPPDDPLWQAALGGELRTSAALAAHARRLLAKPGPRGVPTFFRQWLEIEPVPKLGKSAKQFPGWNAEIAADLLRETDAFIEEALWRDDARWATLMRAPYTTPSRRLAGHYGIQAPTADGARVPLSAGGRRGGLLAQGSVLAVHARADNTFPVNRGRFVRTQLLCQDVPPPPADVAAVPLQPDGKRTQKDMLAIHSQDTSCAGCHKLMDALGLAFETYDAAGRYRTHEGELPIDPSGELAQVSKPGRFDDAAAMVDLMIEQPEARRCFIQKVATFGLGRTPSEQDDCLLADLDRAFVASGGDVIDLLVAFATSDRLTVRQNQE